MKSFIWPRIAEEEINAVNEQLKKSISIYNKSGIIEELENNLSKYFKVPFCLLTNSGTSALHSLYVGLDLKKGDEVICPVYTFYATITPIFFTGAKPVLVDCDFNGNINPDEIEKHITPNTKAIMVTHMWGTPCDMKQIVNMAKKHDLYLLEDGSHAHGASVDGIKIGTFGDASAFSMQGQKVLTGGEGGFILTKSKQIYDRALLLGHYNKRCKQEIAKDSCFFPYATTGMGLKFRAHPLACAIANQQLKKLPSFLEGRNRCAQILIKELSDLKGISVPEIKKGVLNSWYAFIIKFDVSKFSGVTIEDFLKYLLDHDCPDADIPGSTAPLNLLSLFQKPETLFPDYKGIIKYKEGDFPVAESFYSSIIKIPVWDRVEDDDVVYHYIETIKKFVEIHSQND